MIHGRRAKKFYSSIQSATENQDDETFAIYFDYMQNLPLPKIPVHIMYRWIIQFSETLFLLIELGQSECVSYSETWSTELLNLRDISIKYRYCASSKRYT